MVALAKLDDVLAGLSESGYSRSRAALLAGLTPAYVSDILSGRRPLTDDVVTRMRSVLRRVANAHGDTPDQHAAPLYVAYRATFALVAMGLYGSELQSADDLLALLAQHPSRKASKDPVWLKAANVRAITLSVLNQSAGFSQSRLAEIAGSNRSQVNMAIRQLEDRRDTEPQIDDLIETTGAIIAGPVPGWKRGTHG